MDTHPTGGELAVAELPPYRAVLVTDIRDFSGHPGRDHARLTEAMPSLLGQAFERAGLAHLPGEVAFHRSTGDGYALGFRSAVLPLLLNPFLSALEEELTYWNGVRAESGQGRAIRMRVSVNVGPMTDSGRNGIADGSGDARIETHRLLDCEPVRDLLTRSNPVTCVAAVVSSRAFADAVLSGFTAEDPGLYVPVPISVKSYRGTAYLRVPRPSGDLLAHGFRPAEPVRPEPAAGTAGESGAGQVNTAHDVSGIVVQARDHTEWRRGGTGAISGGVGTVITGAQGPLHTGTGDQYNAPRFTGDGTNYLAAGNSGGIRQRFGRQRDEPDGERDDKRDHDDE